MTCRRKTIVIGSLVALLAGGGLIAGKAIAGWHMRHRGRLFHAMMERKVDGLLDQIGATQPQRDLVHGDVTRIEAAFRAFHKDQMAVRHDLLAEFAKPTMDPATVTSLENEQIDAARVLQNEIFGDLVTLHDQLTPAQRAQLLGLIQKHMARHRCQRDEDGDIGPAAAPARAVPVAPQGR